ncbi:hypothetical protein ALDI51_24600 [Alicycliphilus denitrificans]|nr:hypothetical protein ALDI51_24600 [Alicycliphilus denitrificans]
MSRGALLPEISTGAMAGAGGAKLVWPIAGHKGLPASSHANRRQVRVRAVASDGMASLQA